MITDAFRNASLIGLASMFMGIFPLAMGVVYAVWPNEHRLALMRPLSLATIFAAVTGAAVGILNVFLGMSRMETAAFNNIAAIGLAESLAPIFFGFGCLTAAWLCVAVGLWRRP